MNPYVINKRYSKAMVFVFLSLLFVNLVPSLIPFYSGGWGTRFGDPAQVQTNIRVLVNAFNLVLVAVGILLHLKNSRKMVKLPFVFTLLLAFFLNMSYMLGGYATGKYTIFRITFTLVYLFAVLDYYVIPQWVLKFIKWPLILWTTLPVLLLFVYPPAHQMFTSYYEGSFGGFASHKNGYGVLAGISVILLLMSSSRYSLIGIAIILYGILLSRSRATILALGVAVIYFLVVSKKQHLRRFMAIVVTLSIPELIRFLRESGVRDLFVDDARTTISHRYWEVISANMFVGSGGVSTVVDFNGMDINAHNFILQSWADYGLFFVLSYLFLGYALWRKTGPQGRVFILFAFVFGLFQPYMDPGVMGYTLMLVYILIAYHGRVDPSQPAATPT